MTRDITLVVSIISASTYALPQRLSGDDCRAPHFW